MMRLAAVLTVFLFISCSNRTDVPNGILSPDSMQAVMKDIIMASQYSAEYIVRDSLKKDKVKANQELMETVFKIHHTSRETFKQSLDFYESRPDLGKKIFDSLSVYASRHQKDLYMNRPIAPHPLTPPMHGRVNYEHADSLMRRQRALHPMMPMKKTLPAK